MEKEEVLLKSRKENKIVDERERNVQMWAGRMAAGFGIFMCAVLSILASWADKGENYSAWIIFCTIYGSMELMMFLKLRNKWDLILAVIEIGGGILFSKTTGRGSMFAVLPVFSFYFLFPVSYPRSRK